MNTRIAGLALATLAIGCGDALNDDGNVAPLADSIDEPYVSLKTGQACSYAQDSWGTACEAGDVACLRDIWFLQIYPKGMTVSTREPRLFPDAASVEGFLPQDADLDGPANYFYAQVASLKLNLAFSQAGIFGPWDDLPRAVLLGGDYNGWTAAEVLAFAQTVDPATAERTLVEAVELFNAAFTDCPSDAARWPAANDLDNDGVLADDDCNDMDPRVGKTLLEDPFNSDTGYFYTGPVLEDPWVFAMSAGTVGPQAGGQQALLACYETWDDIVIIASLNADGAVSKCEHDGETCDTDRFRAGIISRAVMDGDQGEGYHGYRCAVARNSVDDCYNVGDFVQLAAFTDGEEDDISSECATGCPANTTFEQLDRDERTTQTDVLGGDSALLTFWTVGEDLVCEFRGEDNEYVVSRATDDRFAEGGPGLSTLNAMANFDWIRVCQAFSTP